jgi:hypothetical protein
MAEQAARPPPSGWILSFSKTHNRHYYFHTSKKITQWTFPKCENDQSKVISSLTGEVPKKFGDKLTGSCIHNSSKVTKKPTASLLGNLLGSVDHLATSVSQVPEHSSANKGFMR